MRRILSILLLLVLSVGPALASVPLTALTSGWGLAEAESHLPACCRRNGAHHCAMSQPAAQTANSKQNTISAANCCPCMPGALASNVAPDHALLATTRQNSLLRIESRTAQASETAARISAMRTWPQRGPPSAQSL